MTYLIEKSALARMEHPDVQGRLAPIIEAGDAATEAAGIAVMHYDSDFDRIAAVTGQPTEWVAPAGSL